MLDPKDFVLLLRLISWLDFFGLAEGWDILDFFAGRARVSKWGKKAGYKCAAYDVLYDQPQNETISKHSQLPRKSFMDINSEAGFASLGRQL